MPGSEPWDVVVDALRGFLTEFSILLGWLHLCGTQVSTTKIKMPMKSKEQRFMVPPWKVAVQFFCDLLCFKLQVSYQVLPTLTSSVSSWSGRCWSFGCFFQPQDLTGWGAFGRGTQEFFVLRVFGHRKFGKLLGTQLKHSSMRFHEFQSLAMHVLPPAWSYMISWSLSRVHKNLKLKKQDRIANLMYVAMIGSCRPIETL